MIGQSTAIRSPFGLTLRTPPSARRKDELRCAGAKPVERHPGRRMRRVAGARMRAGARGEAELDLGAVVNQHGEHVLVQLRAESRRASGPAAARSSATTKAGLPRNGSSAKVTI